MTATTAQIRHIRFLLARAKMNEDDKSALALAYSGDRTTSLRELTKKEAMQFIEGFRNAVLTRDELQTDAMRKSILQIAWQLGWQRAGKVDIDRVNAFIQSRGFNREGKADLNSYGYDELVRLRNQFVSMHKNTIKRV